MQVEATSHVDLLKALEVYEQYVANTSSKKSNLELQLPTEVWSLQQATCMVTERLRCLAPILDDSCSM